MIAAIIIAAFALGRAIQGGLLNRFSAWPQSSALARAVYAVIASLSALAWTGNPWIAIAMLPAWYAGCCIPLFNSIGRDDPVWRGALRGALQPVPAVIVIAGLSAAFGHGPTLTLPLWCALGAFSGVAYRIAWRFENRIQPTVWAEFATGALWGVGMLAALQRDWAVPENETQRAIGRIEGQITAGFAASKERYDDMGKRLDRLDDAVAAVDDCLHQKTASVLSVMETQHKAQMTEMSALRKDHGDRLTTLEHDKASILGGWRAIVMTWGGAIGSSGAVLGVAKWMGFIK